MNKRGILFVKVLFITFLSFGILGWVWPTEETTITSDFGPRQICSKSWQFHLGIDIGVNKKKIYAAEDGEAWWKKGTYNTIVVEHGSKTSLYLHCDTAYVPKVEKDKKKVKAGDVIGISGDVGSPGSYHLDFRFEDKSHPLKYLPYSNSANPDVNKFMTPEDGDKVEGTIDIKVYVLTKTDKDLNKCELYIDDKLLKENGTISYDPKVNCSSTTAFPKKVNAVGDDFFVFKWNTNNVENGKHTLKLVATDAGGKTGEKSIEVEVENDAPVVKEKCVEKDGGSLQEFVLSNSFNLSAFMEGTACFLNSYAEDVPIDISTISFTFSKPMDVTTTTPAVTTDFGFSPSWDGEETIKLNLTENLDYCENYTVTISETATDTSGVHLDGDENGEPGGDYEFTFTTEPPDVKLLPIPFVANVEEGYPLKVNLYANGSELKKEIDCNMDFKVYNPGGWSVLTPHTAIGLRLTAKV